MQRPSVDCASAHVVRSPNGQMFGGIGDISGAKRFRTAPALPY
jgi:hypothetical protein